MKNKILILILSTLAVRLLKIQFPSFSPQDAAIAIKLQNWAPFLNESLLRITLAVAGSVFIYFFYRLVSHFFNNEKIAFFSALVVAISPPFIYLSRVPGNFTYSIIGSNHWLGDSLISNINIYRGQGLQSGWPVVVEKLLFNKLYFLKVSVLNWLSSVSPGVLFAQLDSQGIWGPVSLGVFPKILIIPFLIGLGFLIKTRDKKLRLILVLAFLLNCPSFFSFPGYNFPFLIISTPLLAIIIGFALSKLNSRFSVVIIAVAILEVILNIFFVSMEEKASNTLRPGWVKVIVSDLKAYSGDRQIVISDDIVQSPKLFIEWYGGKKLFNKVAIATAENSFFRCTAAESAFVVVGPRDLAFVQKYISDIKQEKVYRDHVGNNVAYKLEERICVK